MVTRSTELEPGSASFGGVAPIDISVVVPVLNAEATIETQLSSLTRQTYRGAWEVIIADNGSTDRSCQIARTFADRLPHLRIIDASDVRGVAHVRNVAVRASRAPLVVFADADDEVADEWLEHVVAALARHSAVASRFDKHRLNSPELRASRELAQEHGLSQHNYAPFLPHAGGSGLGVRVDVHDAIGGFDERLLRLADTDYSWRLQLAGYDLHYEPKALVYVRFRDAPAAALGQAFRYGRFNGHLYHRYRKHGMQHVPLGRNLKSLVILLAKVPFGKDPHQRRKRWHTIANLGGIVLGRLEARFRER